MTICEEFKINGTPIVAPDADVRIQKKDVEASDSGKDESGYLHRYLLRSGVKTWSFAYAHLSREEYEYMENLLNDQTSFTFTYPQKDGTAGTCKAYCPGGAVAIRNIRTGLYSSYSFDVVEC